jgi:hypothetical protein
MKAKRRRPAVAEVLTVPVIVSHAEAAYLVELVRLGIHGSDEMEVIQTFIRRGLQDAYRDGFLVRTDMEAR